MKISNFFKHLSLVLRHKWRVFVNCSSCGLVWRGLVHDMSKFSPTEFFESVKYYQGNRSPIGVCRRETGVSLAWLHHKGRNRHHSEYWIDMNTKTGLYESVPMPKRYLAESVLDRIAASYNYNRKSYKRSMPLEYFYRTKDRTPMHRQTFWEMEMLLKMYEQEGERHLFRFIRKNYTKQR